MVGQELHVPLERTERLFWLVCTMPHRRTLRFIARGFRDDDAGAGAHVLVNCDKLLSLSYLLYPLFSVFLLFRFLGHP